MRGTIRARGKGRWQVQVYAGRDPQTGKERRMARTIEGTRKDAERALTKLLSDVDSRRVTPRSDMTVAELVTRYITHRERDWSPATALEARRQATRYLTPIGGLPLERLRPIDIDACYRQLGDTLAPGTVRRFHSLLRAALGQAVRWDLIASNPAERATPPAVPDPDIAPPDADAVAKLLGSIDDPAWAAFVRLAATTGARRGQLCALQWGDLDLELGLVTFRRALTVDVGGVAVKGTKTGRVYAAALGATTVAVVGEWWNRTIEIYGELGAVPGPETWVFAVVPGGAPWYPDSTSRRWKKMADAHGLAGVRLHDLRHLMATELLGAGVDVVTVTGRGGWSSPNVPLAVYGHRMPAKDRAAADLMDQLLDG